MKRSVIFIIAMIFIVGLSSGCSSSRRYQSDLRGLMLQDNLQMKRNRAYYSKHSIKARKDAFRHHKRNSRNMAS